MGRSRADSVRSPVQRRCVRRVRLVAEPHGRRRPAPVNDLEFRQLIERLKMSLPIEEVVGTRVPGLKPAGSNWKACCPFHEEKTPSFVVTPARGTWHCFGSCSEGGDAISFVQKFDGLTFWEAVQDLAQTAGIELPKDRKRGSQENPRETAALEALERAERLFSKRLAGAEGEHCRRYLSERGLQSTTLEAFGVGFAPGGNALLEAARDSGFSEQGLIDAGLIRKGDEGRAYDFFRSRLMIPIRDSLGRTVGFGGRLLPGAEGPKYVNTPETPLFKKGKLIYGLDRAAKAVRQARHLILMEGYTDVMAAHQVGVGYAGAVLGTATTRDHARLVRKVGARRVSLVFDADDAGRKAVSKALAGLLHLEHTTFDVIVLPEGTDPCDFLLAEGREAFERHLAEPVEWSEFLLSALEGADPVALAEGVDGYLGLLLEVEHSVQRDALLKQCATRLGLDESALRERGRELFSQRQRTQRWRSGSGDRASGSVSSGGASSRGASSSGASSNQGDTRRTGPRSGAAQAPGTPRTAAGPGNDPQRGNSAAGRPVSGAQSQQPPRPLTREERVALPRAWRELFAAALLDNSLIPVHRDWYAEASQWPAVQQQDGLGEVIAALLVAYDETDDPIDGASLLDFLGENERARRLPVSLENIYAVQRDAAPTLAAGAALVLERYRQRTQVREAVYGQPAEDPMELLARADRVLRQSAEAPTEAPAEAHRAQTTVEQAAIEQATVEQAGAQLTPAEPPPMLPGNTPQPELSDPSVPF